MKIDTLVLSGGGPSGTAYIGIFSALFEKGIIKPDLEGIKEIITTSIGIVFSILYMLNINPEAVKKIIVDMDIGSLLNIDEIEIDNLLVNFGLFTNNKIGHGTESIIRHTLHKEDITMKELYEKVPIKLTVKVFNCTLKTVEYINHETDPNLKLSVLTNMTTAIPFFFKPVMYNNYYYVDGGLRGNFPIEHCLSENYLGVYIAGEIFPKDSEILNLFPIIGFIHSLMINQDDIVRKIKSGVSKKQIIYTEINEGLNFNLSDADKERIISIGYESTMNHIKVHSL
jgi:NTE family protein|tara:strand:- start:199 stop:1050 length:852 start_codon:yes stop_codon:yes gene_type:complete